MPEGTVIDLTAPEVQAAIKEAVEKETAGIKANRDELLKEAKRAKDALKNYDGMDPEKYKALSAAAEAAERKKAEAEGNFASLEKQLLEKHGKEIEARESRIGKLSKALERRLVEAELTAAIARAKGVPELLLPHARPHVKVKEADDDFTAYVAGPDGNPRIGDAKGSPMSFDQLVEEMKSNPVYGRAFEGTGSSGSGAPSNASSGGGAAGTLTLSRNDPVAMGRITPQQQADIDSGKLKVNWTD